MDIQIHRATSYLDDYVSLADREGIYNSLKEEIETDYLEYVDAYKYGVFTFFSDDYEQLFGYQFQDAYLNLLTVFKDDWALGFFSRSYFDLEDENNEMLQMVDEHFSTYQYLYDGIYENILEEVLVNEGYFFFKYRGPEKNSVANRMNYEDLTSINSPLQGVW